jgi:hypothetical protein
MSIDIKIKKMPIPYYLNKNGEKSIPLSHIDTADLDRGNKIINMGAWLNIYDNVLPVVMMMCEEGCGQRITHETIHIILYQEEGRKATDLFDVVDIDGEVTQCGFEKPNVQKWLDKYNFPIKTYQELITYLQDQLHEYDKEVIKCY